MATPMRPGPRNLITDVAGISVGQAEAAAWGSGTTVILPAGRAVAAVDVRGGGPGSREMAAIDMDALNDRVDAVVLSGGSAYGLEAAAGVMEWLRDRRRGLAVGPALVPIVPSAILFDLPVIADPSAAGAELPYRALGIRAADAAGDRFALGSVGAGTGATTAGPGGTDMGAGMGTGMGAGTRLKGGLGSASLCWMPGDGTAPVTVGAIVAVNAVGSALIPGSRAFLAAPWEIDGEFGNVPMPAHAPDPVAIPSKKPMPGANTTIAAVATDAPLDKAGARRMAIMAQDGLSRALHPAHTPFDGDTVFALSTGSGVPADADRVSLIGSMAAMCLARAIARGVHAARAISDIPAWCDLPG